MSGSAIELTRISGSASFSNIVIVGNQLALNLNGIIADASGAFNNVVVNDNSINLSSGSSNSAINFLAVSVFHIGGNVIHGNGGTPVGITVAAGSSTGLISPNLYSALTTSINNASSSTTVVTVP
jgi:hypothetical protein